MSIIIKDKKCYSVNASLSQVNSTKRKISIIRRTERQQNLIENFIARGERLNKSEKQRNERKEFRKAKRERKA
tara:strand:+ start:381 stop:599 length:219 start_codon:yes stop_codon:yes gene_type:complete